MSVARFWAAAPVVLALALALGAGCSRGEEERQATPVAQVRIQDCLHSVWQNQPAPDAAFDRAHDRASGGSISCATGTSASRFSETIAALRGAAMARDKERLIGRIALPLLYIDAAGNRSEMATRAEVEARFDEIVDPAMLALLERIELDYMTVSNGEGGFFALGALWLAASEPGGPPKIITINHQALGEAVRAMSDA